jgi:hypothetical protein
MGETAGTLLLISTVRRRARCDERSTALSVRQGRFFLYALPEQLKSAVTVSHPLDFLLDLKYCSLWIGSFTNRAPSAFLSCWVSKPNEIDCIFMFILPLLVTSQTIQCIDINSFLWTPKGTFRQTICPYSARITQPVSYLCPCHTGRDLFICIN